MDIEAATPHAILIVGPAWIGDMVMAQSLFMLLRDRYPMGAIDVLAPGWSLPLLERMPEVRQSLSMPLGHGALGIRVRFRLGRELRAARYDWAIVLANSFKSALVPYWARIPRRTGYVGEWRWGVLNDARRLDKSALPLMVQRFVMLGMPPDAALIDPSPKPALQVSEANISSALQRYQLTHSGQPILALCPGAEYGPAKRWPAEYFAEVARDRLARGWQVWLFGSEKDSAAAAEIAALGGTECVDLTGRTPLADAIDLMSLASVVVTNDSGLMHVAAALGRRVVALYGSSSPAFTPPLSADAEILRLDLDCSPCFQRECPLGHLKCLWEITPNMVLASIDGKGR